MTDGKNYLNELVQLGAWGIVVTDGALRVVEWNRWLEQRTGKTARDVLGRGLLEIYPELVTRGMDRYYRQALDGQPCMLSQRFHKYLLPMPPTMSSTHLMHMQQTARIAPIMEGDAVRGTLTLIEDVTERIVTEEELRRQADRLEEANRHKDEFLAMLAHELRNPLGPIRNGICVLEMVPGGSDQARETREMMERQVKHMARLVDDLLDVSRIARGKVRLRQEACDLNAIVGEVIEDYRPLVEKSGIRLGIELSPTPLPVQGDPVRLAQVVGNVLHNANKFTNAGGEIRVACRPDSASRSAVVQITDSGIGMTRETVARVFDTFTQADASLERSKGGLGLGLSLAKGLVHLHGGAIEAASDGLNQGSTFTLRIPLKTAASRAATTVAEPAVPRGNAGRVLVIEDNPDMAALMRMLLGHHGYQVETATTGPAGIELAQQFLPNIVVCDIGLPGCDGYEVARAIRAGAPTKSAYLIAQSGYGQDEDLRKAQEAGFDLHMTKPVAFADLSKALAAIPQNR